MKVEYINPFIESVYEVFSTMLCAQVSRGTVAISRGAEGTKEIVALIGFSGPARGMLTLSFPVKTALGIVNRLLDADYRTVDETVSDAIAEMVNIVGGSAKARINTGNESPIDLSLPGVVRGDNFSVDNPLKTVWLEVPFQSDLGPFTMRVTLKADNGGAQ